MCTHASCRCFHATVRLAGGQLREAVAQHTASSVPCALPVETRLIHVSIDAPLPYLELKRQLAEAEARARQGFVLRLLGQGELLAIVTPELTFTGPELHAQPHGEPAP